MALLLVVFAGSSLLLAVIAAPMIAGLVPPNPWYGFRTRATLENPEIWYKVNRHSGQRLLAAGLLSFFAALALYPLCAPSEDLYALLFALISLPLLTLGMLDSLRYMRLLQQGER